MEGGRTVRKKILSVLVLAIVLGGQPILNNVYAQSGVIHRIAPLAGDTVAGGATFRPCISGNGRYVAFASYASNYVPDDTNGTGDVFLYDRFERTIRLMSISPTGVQGDNYSSNTAISEDGRYVAFDSQASNFAPIRNPNYMSDIYVRDTQRGTTALVSVTPRGERGNGPSYEPVISTNGRYIAFYSSAPDLVTDDTNNKSDIFVRDMVAGTTERVSVTSTGAQARGDCYSPSMSADGRHIAFRAYNSGLGGSSVGFAVFVHDRESGDTKPLPLGNYGWCDGWPHVSPDGSQVAFMPRAVQGNGYGRADLVLYDTARGTTRTVLRGIAPNSEVYITDSYNLSMSWDARYIAFDSETSTFVTGDGNDWRDVFIVDTTDGVVRRVSTSVEGGDANGGSLFPSISYQGTELSFLSHANNLVRGDTNGAADPFLWEATPAYEHTMFLPLILKASAT
jgi:Tol biopolymer transport system component